MVVGTLKNHRFSDRKFIKFSCFFRTTFQMAFLEGPRADLGPKVRFGSDFRPTWLPKTVLGVLLLAEKPIKSSGYFLRIASAS